MPLRRSGPSLILWFLTGIFASGFYQAYNAYLQAKVPQDRFGRVLTNLYLFRGIPTASERWPSASWRPCWALRSWPGSSR